MIPELKEILACADMGLLTKGQAANKAACLCLEQDHDSLSYYKATAKFLRKEIMPSEYLSLIKDC